MAELISMRLLPLWVGARGIEFSWKYIQLSFEANISLVRFLFFAFFLLNINFSVNLLLCHSDLIMNEIGATRI